jgi:hypothetical protein
MKGKPLFPFFQTYCFQVSGAETLLNRLVVNPVDVWQVFLPG